MATPDNFSQQYAPLATKVGDQLGVSPDLLLTQWGLETGWGKSVIPGTNNLGNIMDFSGGGVAAVDNYNGRTDKYRAFETPEAFGDHFVDLIKRKYPSVVGSGSDAVKFATALKQGGYAEHPEYVDAIVNTAQSFRQRPEAMKFIANAATSDANPPAMSANDPFADLNTKFAIGAAQPTPNRQQNADNPFSDLDAKFTLPTIQQAAPQQTEAPRMSAGDVAYGAATNLIPSAVKYGTDIVQAITNPIGTASSILDVGAGALQNALPKQVVDFVNQFNSNPEAAQRAVAAANAVGGEYAKNYGTLEGFKKHLATDPVAVLGDLSALLTGGGSVMSKVPGITGRAGQAYSSFGRAIDPLNVVTKPITGAAKLAEMLATPTLGMTTGAGAEAIREAAKSGAAGGTRAQAFLDQMRGNAPIENVVNTAKEAVAELFKNRSDAYTSGMGGVTKNTALLDFAPIDQAVAKAQSIGSFNGIEIRGNAAAALREIADKVAEFKAGDPAIFRTVEGFDKLKQAIGDIQQSLPYGTPARTVADGLYNSVKNEIVKQAPDYAKVMGDYENASALLKDIQGTLSLNKNANVDTSIRKLQSIMRNNANTNYGRRVDLAKELEATGVPGADTLFPQIAGQMLNSKTPRGIQGGVLPAAAGGAALTAAFTNPMALIPIAAGALASSPRLVGEAAYYGGKAGGAAQKLAEALKSYSDKSPIDPYTLRMLATKLGQQQTEEQR
jgi:hypothetical protein